MEHIMNTVSWLLEHVIDDPVKLVVVLMFLALIFAIWVLGKTIGGQKTKE